MKEIKFRAYNGERMIGECQRQILQALIDDGWAVMQFIGLRDKNSKEIYEGDIVRFSPSKDDSHITIATVFWDEDRASFNARMRDYPQHHLHQNLHHVEYLTSYEVIGNIYENPELLKGGD